MMYVNRRGILGEGNEIREVIIRWTGKEVKRAETVNFYPSV
jgi:hypothetical protein